MGSYENTMLRLERMAASNTATQMNWQEKMSKSSHQMEVEDLLKAGLNPTLSANQGANAYTTQVDSAVNGIANMASSREAANATRFAARQSAAATRAAAAAQLAAAKYSSDRAFDANQFAWETKKSIQEGVNATQLEIVDKQPPQRLSGLIWKCIDQSGLRPVLMNTNVASFLKIGKKIISDPSSFFTNNGAVKKNNFNLSKNGVSQVNSILKRSGLTANARNRNLFVKFITFGDQNSGTLLFSQLRNRNKI